MSPSRPGQSFRLEVAGPLVAPQAVDCRSRVEEARLGGAGPGDDVQPTITVHIGEGDGGDRRLIGTRELDVRCAGKRASTIEENVATVHPGAKKEVGCAVPVEVDEGDHRDNPIAHGRKVDLLQREAPANVGVQEHAEIGPDHDVGPAVTVHVTRSDSTHVHRSWLHELVGAR